MEWHALVRMADSQFGPDDAQSRQSLIHLTTIIRDMTNKDRRGRRCDILGDCEGSGDADTQSGASSNRGGQVYGALRLSAPCVLSDAQGMLLTP